MDVDSCVKGPEQKLYRIRTCSTYQPIPTQVRQPLERSGSYSSFVKRKVYKFTSILWLHLVTHVISKPGSHMDSIIHWTSTHKYADNHIITNAI